MRTVRVFFVLLISAIFIFASRAASFLVVDQPEKSDAIVVLAGETSARPTLAMDLLHKGFAPHVFIDAEIRDRVYNLSLIDVAKQYVDGLGEASRVSICPISGLSTYGEADDVNRCLQSVGAHSVLIVTSEFHTRRASLILSHRLPQYHISITAAHNPIEFGTAWWTKREWAKTTFDEWLKLFWWEAVDRWRS